MYYLQFDSIAIEQLKNTNGPYYFEDGSYNLEALSKAASELSKQKSCSMHCAWLLYYMMQIELDTKEKIQTVLKIWQEYAKTLDESSYMQLQMLHQNGVDIGSRVRWLIEHAPPTKGLPSALTELGVYTYAIVNPDHVASIAPYIPSMDLSERSAKTRFISTTYQYASALNIIELSEKLFSEGLLDLGHCFIRSHFRNKFTTLRKQHYAVADAMAHAWPLMYRHKVSMVDTLIDIRKNTKGRFFFSDIMAWYDENEHSNVPSIQEARRQMALALESEIEQSLTKTTEWSIQEYGFAKLASRYAPDHRLYESTRERIAQTALVSQTPYNTCELVNILLQSGEKTYRMFLDQLTAKKRVNEFFRALFSQTNNPLLVAIVQHPVFRQFVDTKQLFNHQMDWLGPKFDNNQDQGFYNIWAHPDVPEDQRRKFQSPPSCSSLVHVISQIGQLHTQMFPGQPLKDHLSKELTADLWGLLGASIALQLRCKLYTRGYPWDNSYLRPSNVYAMPTPIMCMAFLDFELLGKHRQDLLTLLNKPDNDALVTIYTTLMNEVFGNTWSIDDLSSIFIKDNASLVQFFRMQYIQNHPDFGETLEAIELGDIF